MARLAVLSVLPSGVFLAVIHQPPLGKKKKNHIPIRLRNKKAAAVLYDGVKISPHSLFSEITPLYVSPAGEFQSKSFVEGER